MKRTTPVALLLALTLLPAGALRADAAPAADTPSATVGQSAAVAPAFDAPGPATKLDQPVDAADGPEAGLGDGEMPDPGQQRELALSPEQKDKLKVIRQAGREKHRQHMQKIQALIGTLADQLQAQASDADLQGTLAALKAEKRSQQADQDASLDQAEAVLSPTQAARYVLHLREQMKAGLKRWKAQLQ